MSFQSHHVVIAGAGYAGLPCAFKLAAQIKRHHLQMRLRVTLINPEPAQELTCDLYRCLRSGDSMLFPFTKVCRKLGIQFLEGRLHSIVPAEKKLRITGQTGDGLSYDSLILATGRKSLDPAIEGLEALRSPSTESPQRIFQFRKNAQVQSLRLGLERINWKVDAPMTQDTFVVVMGAGATGLEVAGEIAAMRGKNKRARVVLMDEKSEVLDGVSPVAQKLLKRELRRMNIETLLGSRADRISEHEIVLNNGQVVPWDLLVLCTGLQTPQKWIETFGHAASAGGLETNAHFQIEGFPNHYVIGDLARIPANGHSRDYLPQRAQFAVQEGEFLAEQLFKRIAEGQTRNEKFSAHELGYLVTLGPSWGVGRLGPKPQSKFSQLISPFIVGASVNRLKEVVRLRYLLTLRYLARSWF